MMYPHWFVFCLAILLGYLSFIDWLYLSISIFDICLLILFWIASVVVFLLSNDYQFYNKFLFSRLALLLIFMLGFLACIKKKKMGMGDLWVFCFTGLLLRPIDVLESIYFSFLSGGFYSILLVLWDPKNLKKKIPFIPFLTIGFLLAILFDIL